MGKPTKSYKHCRNYTHFDIYYTSVDTSIFTFLLEDSIIRLDTILPSSNIKRKSLQFNRAPSSFELKISSTTSPLIYGISLEGNNGVVVDNIPMRGASGTEFARIDKTSLKEMHQLLSPDLFLMEFGGNTIPYMKSIERSAEIWKIFKKPNFKIETHKPQCSSHCHRSSRYG